MACVFKLHIQKLTDCITNFHHCQSPFQSIGRELDLAHSVIIGTIIDTSADSIIAVCTGICRSRDNFLRFFFLFRFPCLRGICAVNILYGFGKLLFKVCTGNGKHLCILCGTVFLICFGNSSKHHFGVIYKISVYGKALVCCTLCDPLDFIGIYLDRTFTLLEK